MTRFQFTLRALLMALPVVALGSAALANASPLWRWIVTVATIIILTVALLRALMLGREAAFCVGFAATGWIWLALAWEGFVYLQHPNDLPMKYLAEQRYGIFWRDDVAYTPPAPGFLAGREDWIVEAIAFYDIGELLASLAAAFCGGLATTYIAGTKRRRQGGGTSAEAAPPK